MINKYQFRGKEKCSGELAYGDLLRTGSCTSKTKAFIVVSDSYYGKRQRIEVFKNSISRCTGMKDRCGKIIYEGDMVEFITDTWDNGQRGTVVLDEGCWSIKQGYAYFKLYNLISIIKVMKNE